MVNALRCFDSRCSHLAAASWRRPRPFSTAVLNMANRAPGPSRPGPPGGEQTADHRRLQRRRRFNPAVRLQDTRVAPLLTSDVGLKHGRVDVDVKVHGVLEERRHALKLRTVPQNLQRRQTSDFVVQTCLMSMCWNEKPSGLTSRVSRASIRVREKLQEKTTTDFYW